MPDEVLCPRCKRPIAVQSDGSMICEHCLIGWDSLEDLQRDKPKDRPPPSVEAKRLLAKEVRTDANYRIRELLAELDPLSTEQFAMKRRELMERFGLSKAEINNFYQKAHAPKHAPPEQKLPSEKSAEDLPFRILGTANDGQAYFIDRSERLMTLRMGNLTKTQLFLLADRDWWEGMFAGARGRMDLDGAINFLIKAANGKSFDSDRLRGRGCWREE